MDGKEIELIDYLNIIWRRKWLIIGGTLLCVIIAAVFSVLTKPVYEIDAIVQPGKFFIENQSGHIEQIVVEQPQQIADKVNHRSFDVLIAAELDIDISELSELKSDSIRDTLLTRVWTRDSDTERGQKVLTLLLDFIKRDMDEKIDVEIDNINADIKENEIEKERRTQEIEILKKKLKIIGQRKRDLAEEMKSVKVKVEELEKEQLSVLKKENKSELESLGLLLYSNEIQQSFRYLDILNEKLSNEKLQEENVNSALQQEKATIGKLDNTIANLKETMGRIDLTKIVKNPTRSVYPVFPRKKLNVLIAAILGLVVFTLLVLFLDYLESKKQI
jgi:LPS O-antigen subunit length determinant protein (WzzB/FepE family)